MSIQFDSKVSGNTLHILTNFPRLDASTAASLKAHLQEPLAPEVCRAEVDMSSVQFIDSSGVGVLLSLYRKLPKENAEVVLLKVQPAVLSVLELLRLHRIFKVE